jgi:hypothetical protein
MNEFLNKFLYEEGFIIFGKTFFFFIKKQDRIIDVKMMIIAKDLLIK